jgi:hypothetical protein
VYIKEPPRRLCEPNIEEKKSSISLSVVSNACCIELSYSDWVTGRDGLQSGKVLSMKQN